MCRVSSFVIAVLSVLYFGKRVESLLTTNFVGSAKSLHHPIYFSIRQRNGADGKWLKNYKSEYNHLDDQNMKKLEKIFYLKNKRYSPYNKAIYMNRTQPETIFINQQIIENINKEIMSNMAERDSLPDDDDDDLDDDDDNYDEDDDDLDDEEPHFPSDPRKSRPKSTYDREGNGYYDKDGVYRYRDPTVFFIPKHMTTQGKNSPSNNEFDTGSQFQIIRNSSYSFQDIGGYDTVKKELLQTADILINYDKYQKFNVRTPKGMIFEGPPGNGKTLMAKGFSGEINVTFIPVSGSEFSEKYVGVGASRVRELFKLAEENKPCIIFIDEIDALARKRGNDMVSSNSEKDQTLNQLLINLDGYKDAHGIFVIGATNRLDLLDPALVRAGRMDKHIFIGNPDSTTRRAIIDIHLQGKPLDPSVDIHYIVEMTGGFSGAQIENLLNESMLRALRENREIITFEDLEFIANRILAGWQSTESKYSDDIIDRIAIHEMGHALVGFFSKAHSKLVKVCLNTWSPKTPGYTIFDSNDEDSNIYTKNGLFAHLMVLLSGRIAEEVFYGYSVTTGAKKDFEEAYILAHNMIVKYGMGKKNIYPDSSDQSKFLIDQEVNELILKAQEESLEIITSAKELLLDCKVILKNTNLLKPEDIVQIIENKYPELQRM
jgi:cell division protease FtsH